MNPAVNPQPPAAIENPGVGEFAGFPHFNANYIYTLNQFLYIALPLLNGPEIKILGYFLYATFRLIDDDLNPVYDDVTITSAELSKVARVGERHVKPALDALEKYNFIECVQRPRRAKRGKAARSGIYRIKRAPVGSPYTNDINQFVGFHSGRGYYTRIPDSFYTYILPYECHSNVKIVGVVLRETLGQHDPTTPGGRRLNASLSYTQIKQLVSIKSNDTVARCLADCERKHYIKCQYRGVWNKNRKFCKAAVYSPYYVPKSEILRQQIHDKLIVSLSLLHAENSQCTSQIKPKLAPPKSNRTEHLPNQTEALPKTNRSTSQIKPKQHLPNRCAVNTVPSTNNKQGTDEAGKDIVVEDLISRLRKKGVSASGAKKLVTTYEPSRIENKLQWVPETEFYKNADNPGGVMVDAIRDNWQPSKQDLDSSKRKRRGVLIREFDNANDDDIKRWQEKAKAATSDPKLKALLSGTVPTFEPPKQILDQMALEMGLPTIDEPTPVGVGD